MDSISVTRAGLCGRLTALISLRQSTAHAATDCSHRRSVRFLVAPDGANYTFVPPVAPFNRTDGLSNSIQSERDKFLILR
jgi:hypothetical protein